MASCTLSLVFLLVAATGATDEIQTCSTSPPLACNTANDQYCCKCESSSSSCCTKDANDLCDNIGRAVSGLATWIWAVIGVGIAIVVIIVLVCILCCCGCCAACRRGESVTTVVQTPSSGAARYEKYP